MSEERYALFDGDRVYYYLGSGGPFFYRRGTARVTSGEPMEKSPEPGWWFVDGGPATLIEQEHPGGQDLLGWELIPEVVATEGLPPTLTVEEREKLLGELDDEPDPRAALYRPRFQARNPSRISVVGPFMRLDGVPPPNDGMQWNAKLPFALRYAREYRHLFPGSFDGFRDALVRRLNELNGVNAYANGPVKVYAHLRFGAPMGPPTRPARKSKREARERTLEVPLSPPVRDAVTGPNRAVAKEEWTRLMADYVDQVEHLTRFHVCSTCRGEGFILTKDAR